MQAATPARNLLLLLVGDEPPRQLREEIVERFEPPLRIHVVAPARVRPLDWLATAEGDAQRQAEVRVLEIEWTLAEAGDVEGEAGESDPVQAVDDALRSFPADEILVSGADVPADLEAGLRHFGLPVQRLGAPRQLRRPGPVRRGLRALAAGRHDATPFVLFVGVNLALLLLGILLALLVLLILWLAGQLS